MTDETEAVARALAPLLEGGREFDQMPATRRELKIWNRAGMCSCNDATQDDARETAQLAITALDKLRVERAGEVERELMAGDPCSVELAPQAAATIAALRAKLAQAEERGVRMGIEAAAGAIRNDVFAEAQDTEWDTGFNYAKKLAVSMVLHLCPTAIIRALDAEAIAKGITTADTLSELAAADAVLLDLPARRVEDWTQNFTRGDSDGDDGA